MLELYPSARYYTTEYAPEYETEPEMQYPAPVPVDMAGAWQQVSDFYARNLIIISIIQTLVIVFLLLRKK